MGKGKKKRKDGLRAGSQAGAKVGRMPKSECCVSKDRCQRCPIRMLQEGTLPDGYTVKKRKLVKAGPHRKSGQESAQKSSKKLPEAA